jgi:hypothetical protein
MEDATRAFHFRAGLTINSATENEPASLSHASIQSHKHPM